MSIRDGIFDISGNFEFNKDQLAYKLLGNKVILLKRALMKKNVKIDVYPEKGVPQFFYRWVARGRDKSIVFRGGMPLNTTFKANKIIKDKSKTKKVLGLYGVKVPDEILVDKSDIGSAREWFDKTKMKKVVVKPLFGSGGKGVFSGIASKNELEKIFSSSKSKKLIVEEHVSGDDHRVLVVGGKVVAAMRRWPANVTGDGEATIEELVKRKNVIRESNPYDKNYPIVIDSAVVEKLLESGLTSESILPAGDQVFLKEIANIGAGGEGEDVTDIIHEDFAVEAIKCCKAFDGLEVCGVDIIAEDISKPIDSQSHAVIEINANCDIPIHHWPAIGKPLDVASKIADYYFPDDEEEWSHSARVVVKGKVQKVGFRKWLAKQAVIHGVTGFCENGENGEVVAFLEGSKMSVESLISLCGRGPEKADVESVSFEKEKCQEFQKFSINK